MPRFSELPGDAKSLLWAQGLGTRCHCGEISLIDPFQHDYSASITAAISRKDRERKEKQPPIKTRENLGYKIYPPLPPTAYRLETPELHVHLFSGCLTIPCHGMGDVAVLESKTTQNTHLVLYGETQKRWLDRGLAELSAPNGDFLETAANLVQSWVNFFTPFCEGKEDHYEIFKAVADELKVEDPVGFCKKFLFPIQPGKIWKDPENYDYDLRETLFSKPEGQNPAAMPGQTPATP